MVNVTKQSAENRKEINDLKNSLQTATQIYSDILKNSIANSQNNKSTNESITNLASVIKVVSIIIGAVMSVVSVGMVSLFIYLTGKMEKDSKNNLDNYRKRLSDIARDEISDETKKILEGKVDEDIQKHIMQYVQECTLSLENAKAKRQLYSSSVRNEISIMIEFVESKGSYPKQDLTIKWLNNLYKVINDIKSPYHGRILHNIRNLYGILSTVDDEALDNSVTKDIKNLYPSICKIIKTFDDMNVLPKKFDYTSKLCDIVGYNLTTN